MFPEYVVNILFTYNDMYVAVVLCVLQWHNNC